MAGEKEKTVLKAPDFTLLITVLALVIIGIIMVFSASSPEALKKFGDANYFLRRQLVFSVIGFIGMIGLMNIDYRIWKKFSFPIFILSAFLCALVIFTPLGKQRNNAYRWLKIGIEFMPSDIMKIASIIFMATFLSNKQRHISTFRHGTLPALIIIAMSIGFIFQNDLGTTIIIFTTLAAMFFIGGMNLLNFIPIGAGVVAVYKLIPKILPEDGFRYKRLVAFVDPFAYKSDIGWQVVQSLYAIGSGGLFGLGLGQSRQKFFYVSEAYNDFIFAIIAEELGLIRALMIIGLYLLLIWRGIRISIGIKDMFGKFLAAGLTALIAIQTFIHIGVVTSSIPTTGVTLPFISYGGTSLVITMSAMGILLNISRHSNLDRS